MSPHSTAETVENNAQSHSLMIDEIHQQPSQTQFLSVDEWNMKSWACDLSGPWTDDAVCCTGESCQQNFAKFHNVRRKLLRGPSYNIKLGTFLWALWNFAESRWKLYWGCGKAWPPCFRWSRPRAWRCRCWGATSCSRWCWWRCPSASPPSSSTSTTASRAPTACPPGSAASSYSACPASSAWGCPSRLVGPNFSVHITTYSTSKGIARTGTFIMKLDIIWAEQGAAALGYDLISFHGFPSPPHRIPESLTVSTGLLMRRVAGARCRQMGQCIAIAMYNFRFWDFDIFTAENISSFNIGESSSILTHPWT